MNQGFDLIGDIHGHADALEALLRRLGYDDVDGCYRHDERKALFLGDYIDGGQSNRRVYKIVRTMVEQGEAFAIMGNHEYNAICYHTPAPRSTGGWLREHSAQKRGQHQTTLSEFDDDPAGLVEMVDWFKTLPLYIELDGLRAVHACWDASALRHVDRTLGPSARFTDDFLLASAQNGTPEHETVEILLKGAEFRLPQGISFKDKYGHSRNEARVRWWLAQSDSLDAMVIGPTELYTATRDQPPANEALIGYPADAPPVFFGHYWLHGQPALQQHNVVCLDYSVARDGKLVAYRWDGEQNLEANHFAWCDSMDKAND